MQNHHISGGRAYQNVRNSFRFRDIDHVLFFFLRPREIFQIFQNPDNTRHVGYQTKALDARNQKNTFKMYI